MLVPIPLKSIMFCALTPGNFFAIRYNDSPDLTTYSVYSVPAGIGFDGCACAAGLAAV